MGTLPTDFTFTGQRAEAGIGLMDYRARFYDPVLGRFIQPDTIVPEAGNPQALNRYSYVLGNPLRYTDPSGYCIPGVNCPGDVSGIEPLSDPSSLRGEAYAAWLTHYILWQEQQRAETGGMLNIELSQQAAAFELSCFLMKDPELLGDILYQQVMVGAPQFIAQAAGAATDVLISGAGWALGKVQKAANPLPGTRRFARAVPKDVATLIDAGCTDITLAKPEDPDVFITAAEDLARYRSQSSVERRLGLPPGQRAVVTFNLDVDVAGIASPIRRNYPEFVGGGRTRGGAREWVIPNRPLNELPIWNVKVRYLR